MLMWATAKGFFPSILLLRRYIKIVASYCDQSEYLETDLERVTELDTPFDLRLLPTKFPPLSDLRL